MFIRIDREKQQGQESNREMNREIYGRRELEREDKGGLRLCRSLLVGYEIHQLSRSSGQEHVTNNSGTERV